VLIAQVLFSAYYDVQMPADVALSLVKLIQFVSAYYAVNSGTEQKLFQVAYTLVLTFLAAIEPTHTPVRPTDGVMAPNQLTREPALASKIMAELSGNWQHRTSACLCGLRLSARMCACLCCVVLNEIAL